MKRLALILTLLSAIVLLFVFVINSMNFGLKETADTFFTALGKKQIKVARTLISTEFRHALSAEEFASYIHSSGLDRYKTAVWEPPSYAHKQGELKGIVHLQDGAVQPIQLFFVKEGKNWYIHSIEAKISGFSPQIDSEKIPPLPVLRTMISTTVQCFGKCVLNNNFEAFYAEISALWQSKTSAAKLLQSFQAFVEQKVDLSAYTVVSPKLSESPRIDEDKKLQLKGYFPHEKGTLYFQLIFIFEYPKWKLYGLNVSLEPPV